MKTYRHLTKVERGMIYVLLRRGLSLRDIAKDLGRSAGTISREIRRNLVQKHYNPHPGRIARPGPPQGQP